MEQMISLFNNKATKEQLLETNGDYILTPICTKAVVKEVVNVDYSTQWIFQISDEYKEAINGLVEDAILKAKDEEGDEFFRIVNVRKVGKTIEVFAVHITIRDIVNMWLEDVRPENQTGNGAINWIFDNAKGGHSFNVSSNITNVNTAYYQDMNVYNALYGADNSFLVRWGGETRRRGFNIAIDNRIGQDRGMQIRSKKNLTGFEATTSIDDLCTVLYVKGFDGIKLEQPVVSPYVNLYSKPYYKEIKYEDIKVRSENNPDEGYNTIEEARAEMKRRALLEFSENHIDVIKAMYNIKFAQLEQTEEYKNYSMIETALLGDTVEVIEDNFGVNIKVRVLEREYDLLSQRRISTTLSNTAISKPVRIEEVLKELENNKNPNGRPNLAEYINAMINSGLKDSYVVLKPNEFLIMDSKDINTAKNVTRYNKNGLGFSQNGYWGNYKYGFTIDGKINADLITTGSLSADMIKTGSLNANLITTGSINASLIKTGVLNADLIKTGTMTADRIRGGVLESIDGNLQIDLTNTAQGMQFKRNGVKSIDISGSRMSFHDWQGTTRTTPVGVIFSGRYTNATAQPGLTMAHEDEAFLSLSHKNDTGEYSSYILMDKNKKSGAEAPIVFYQDMVASGKLRLVELHPNFITLGKAKLYENNGITTFSNVSEFSIYDTNNRGLFYLSQSTMTFRLNGEAYFYKASEANRLVFAWDVVFLKNQHTNGNFTVSGTKNCVQETENYGQRLFYATEDAEPLLTDTGKGITKEINGVCEAVVLIDNIFKESVDLTDYYVFLTKYGRGDIWIKEQTKDYFIIESENPIKFNWKIEAKRKGFEDKRLEEYISKEVESTEESAEVKTVNFTEQKNSYPNCGIIN